MTNPFIVPPQAHASSNRENKRQGAVVTNPFIVPSAKSVAAVFPTSCGTGSALGRCGLFAISPAS